MKLLIVLGLFPLFSAQQFGFGSFSSASPSSQSHGYRQNNNNNNNDWPGLDFNNNNNFGGFGSNNNNKQVEKNENLPGLDRINAELIRQLRAITESLVSMLRQVATDPQAGPAVNSIFNSVNSVCLSSMDEAIEAIQQGTSVAEAGLVESTKLLDNALGQTSSLGQESLQAGIEALTALTGSSEQDQRQQTGRKPSYNYNSYTRQY